MATDAIGAGLVAAQPHGAVEVPASMRVKNSAAKPAADSQPQKTAKPRPTPPTTVVLQKAVDQANKVLEARTSNEAQFSVVKGTGITVVKMIDQSTGKTITQFPSETMIEIAKTIDQVTGAIIKAQA